jgi:hypothetical protein
MTLSKFYIRHLKALGSGEVTKTNIIGLKKALNAQRRKNNNWSISRTSPKVEADELASLIDAVYDHQPVIVGELHDSGLKLLRSPRNRRRFTDRQREIIDQLDHFRLVNFGDVDGRIVTPVYRAVAKDGRSFKFRNVPWQSGGNGPEILS